jgi:Ca2+-transporting ATPase
MAMTEAPPTATSEAPLWHVLTREGVVEELGVAPEQGLTSEEAASRLARYGPNRFAEAKTESRWHAFLRQYRDPMQIVLLVAGVISIYPVKQAGTGIVILLLTLFNAALGLQQEGKAAAAVAALAKMMIVKARVRRDGALTQLPAEELVPGDVVAIEAGDVVPPTAGCSPPRRSRSPRRRSPARACPWARASSPWRRRMLRSATAPTWST